MSGSLPSAYTIRREGLRLDIALVERALVKINWAASEPKENKV